MNENANNTKWHPYKNYTVPGTFSVAMYADVSRATVSSTSKVAIIVGLGNNSGLILCKTAANTLAVYSNKALVEGLSITSDTLASGFHFIAFGRDAAGGAFLAVDGEYVSTTTVPAAPGAGFQFAGTYGGIDTSKQERALEVLVDELRGYDVMLSDAQCDSLAALFPATAGKTVTRTLAAGENLWKVTEGDSPWSEGTATSNDTITLTANEDCTVKLNTSLFAKALTIEGTGKVTFTADTNKFLITPVLTANTNVDLGAVVTATATTLPADKEVTTSALANLGTITGTGTVALHAATPTTAISGIPTSFANPLKITQGTWSLTGQNGANYPKTIPVTVSGAGATLRLQSGDGPLGWESANPNKKLTIEDNASFILNTRDSFSFPLVLDNGNMLSTSDSTDGNNRSHDFCGGSSMTVRGTSTMGGTAATADAETGDLIVASGVMAMRRHDFPITVEENGLLKCYSAWSQAGNQQGGSIKKQGAGTMEVFRAATLEIPASVEAGTLRMTNKGQLVKANQTITVAAGATLELNSTTETYTQEIDAAKIAGAGAVKKVGTGTTKLTGDFADTFTGTITIAEGSLLVPAGKENKIASVTDGAKLKIQLTADQVMAEEGYTAQVASGVTSVVFVGPSGTELTSSSDNPLEYKPANNTWTPNEATAEGSGKYAWDNAANWSKGEVPADGAAVTLTVSEATTLVLPAGDITPSALAKDGDGALTIETVEGTNFTLPVIADLTVAKICGPGTVIKTGAAILLLQNSNSGSNGIVVEDATIKVTEGKLKTTIGAADPRLTNVTLIFSEGATFESYGWLNIADQVTVEVLGGTLAFNTCLGSNPANGKLIKTGAGTFSVEPKVTDVDL